MKRFFYLLFILLVPFAVANGQDTAVKPEEQARVKPLIAEYTKAQEALNAKIDQMPEAKTVREAQAALEKAITALKKASESAPFPERDAAKTAEAKVVREFHRILADHRLSSLEYRPMLDDKREMVIVKVEQPKSQ